MSLIEYGSFLSKEARAKARYEFYKPTIGLVVACLSIFMLTGLMVTGFGLWLENMSIPQKNYNVTKFVKAEKVDKDLRESLGALKNTRPQQIDVCKVVNQISKRPVGIELTDIAIKPELYTVKGTAVSSNRLKEYLLSLGDEKHKATLKDITDKDRLMHFTVVVSNPAPQKKGAKGK